MVEGSTVGSAFGALRSLANDTGPAILLLVDELTRSQMIRALQSGVRGILPRDASAAELFAAIDAVTAGLTAFHADDLDLLQPTSD